VVSNANRLRLWKPTQQEAVWVYWSTLRVLPSLAWSSGGFGSA